MHGKRSAFKNKTRSDPYLWTPVTWGSLSLLIVKEGRVTITSFHLLGYPFYHTYSFYDVLLLDAIRHAPYTKVVSQG